MKLTEKITNVKQALSDSKIRVLFLFLIGVAIMTSSIAYVKLRTNKMRGATPSSVVTNMPNISSIPGMGQPTREYIKLQEQENRNLSMEAIKKGISAIPTVVRSTYLDQEVSADLLPNSGAASVAGCSASELTRARLSGVTASELHCRGCSAAALRAAGFSAADLKAAGFSAADLKAIGFSAEELKAAGFSAKDLAEAGFSAKDLLAAGFSVGELKDAGFSVEALRDAGINEEKIASVGFGAVKLSSTGECSMQKLQLARGKGISAQDVRKMGCSAEALRAAGYTAVELKDAGFSAAELKAAGFSTADLKAAGFSAAELKDAGFSAKDLMAAGFSAEELKAAGFSAGELRAAGFSAEDLKNAGFSAAELKAGGFSAEDLKNAGFSEEELKAAGFTAGDLIRAGFAANIAQVKASTSSCSADELKKTGFSAAELMPAGFNLNEIGAAAAYLNTLKNPVGVNTTKTDMCSVSSLKEIKAKRSDLAQLKQYGCTAADFKAAGFSAAELLAAGFTVGELKKAGFSAADIKAARLRLEADAKNIKEPVYSNKLTNEQMNNMTSLELDDLMKKQQALMKQQAGDLFSAWARMPAQLYVAGEDVQAPPVGNIPGVTPNGQQDIAKNSDIYKAGTVIFGILDAEVNTDENSPVMATVIHGPLNGSKVLGTFQRVDKKVLLQFKVLNIPKLINSIGFNAVAIDPNTAKTVLASKVDNHYWLRYGTMFATSFASGLGSAMQNAGSTTDSNTNGITTTMPELDFKQKALVALGSVGQQFSSIASSLSNTPPTVTVKAGTSIGLLLMADLVVPKNK